MKRVFLLGALLALGACGDQSALPPVTVLSAEAANDVGAGYSPDGARIYWWQRDGDQWVLWVSPADMGAPERLPLKSQGTAGLVWSPDGSRFAVGAAIGTSLPLLWVMDTARGSTPRRVTASEGLEQPVVWHPDGRRLGYVTLAAGSVVALAVDVDGGTPFRMVPGLALPHIGIWSPDGSRIAVQVFDQGRATIWLADSVGNNVKQLTTEGFEGLASAVSPWSPDGELLLYTSRRTGTEDIWVLPVDGGAPRQLTTDVRDDQNAIWSPDGQWIAFFSNRGLQSDLWIMPAAGGPAERVTDDVLVETLLGWRPGTGELAYTTGRTSRTLWAHALADGTERQLTPDSAQVTWFNLSPDMQVMVNFNRGGGVNDFAVLPIGGGEPRIILPNAGGSSAWWSPDSQRLLFDSDRGGSQDIWVIDAAEGTPRQLTNWPGQETSPRWSTDGSEVYFIADREATFGDVWRVPAAGGEPTRVTSTGKVVGIDWQPWRQSNLFVTLLGGAQAIVLARLRADGSLLTLWDRTPAAAVGISPTTDSVAISVGVEGGGQQTMLLSIDGGEGRPLLEPGQGGQAWSPDGTQLVYGFRAGDALDVGILTLADGSTRRVTTTPESEGGTEWSADGKTLVFQRSVPINRITTANVTKLLAGPQQ